MFSKFSRTISSRSLKTLVIGEHNASGLNPATLAVVTAANKVGGDVGILLASDAPSTAAESAAKIPGVSQVLTASGAGLAGQLPEAIAPIVKSTAEANSATHIFAPATAFGKNLLPRVAALMDVQQISDVVEIHDEHTFTQPIYAGNALQKVKSLDAAQLCTIRGTAFDDAEMEGGSATVTEIDGSGVAENAEFLGQELVSSDRPELTAAPVVISGGRGLKNGENFEMLYNMADKCGAAVGASRAAVDAGYVPNDMQIGQTGKIVAPNLYIAVGISGAIQHLAGMKDSKTIVAINKDPEAPIFQVSDYGLVGDLFKVVPEMNEKM